MHPESSTLCLTRGLCCTGDLFPGTLIAAEDRDHVSQLGLTVEQNGTGAFWFRQPCLLYQAQCCSRHPERPRACQAYRCGLLEKLERGDVGFEEARRVVRKAKEWIASNKRLRPAGMGGSGRPQNREDAEWAIQAAALDVYLEKHFRGDKGRKGSRR